MLSYNILYRCWVSYDLIIMAWLHTMWSNDLCCYRDNIWCYGIAFHIAWNYYRNHLLSFRDSGISYGIVISACSCILYCMTLHIILDLMAYDTMLLWHTTGHNFWLMAIHAVTQYTDLIWACIISYCLIRDLFIAFHRFSFVGILWHLMWYCSFSIHCDIVLCYLSQRMGRL